MTAGEELKGTDLELDRMKVICSICGHTKARRPGGIRRLIKSGWVCKCGGHFSEGIYLVAGNLLIPNRSTERQQVIDVIE